MLDTLMAIKTKSNKLSNNGSLLNFPHYFYRTLPTTENIRSQLAHPKVFPNKILFDRVVCNAWIQKALAKSAA